MFNWTAVEGVDPRPYATAIKYYCPRDNWAYPSTGFNEVMVYCLKDGTWSNQFNIETCQSKGSHQIQGLTTFPQRCSVLTSLPRPLRVRAPKGFLGWKWPNTVAKMDLNGPMGNGPIWRWNVLTRNGRQRLYQSVFVSISQTYDLRLDVPVARSCGMTIPVPLMGMDVAWPYKKRQLGDTITYTCPSQTLTWEEHLEYQVVTCIWHRQTDSMIWWPPELHSCNRKIIPTLCPTLLQLTFIVSVDREYPDFLNDFKNMSKSDKREAVKKH